MTSHIGNFALSLAILASMAAVLASFAAVRFESSKPLNVARGLIALFAALMTIAMGARRRG